MTLSAGELTPAMFQIMLSLIDGERHGYSIMREIAQRTEGEVRVGAATLYRCIKRMVDTGLIAETDEHMREVLERYGGLYPVTFGHCGYPGLCVRGTARAFCIGCPFLVCRPEYFDGVEFVHDGLLEGGPRPRTHGRPGRRS